MDDGSPRSGLPVTDQTANGQEAALTADTEEGPPLRTPTQPVTAQNATPVWYGGFAPFMVGDPGRAADAPSYPDPAHWDRHDTVIDGVVLRGADRLPSMTLRAASTRGRSHRFNAKVRQDAYAFRCDGRFVVAAVADGVGSRTLSHAAADVVSQHGCHMIGKQLETARPEELDWAHILRVLGGKVISAGRRGLRGSRPNTGELDDSAIASQLATTALFAVLEMRPTEGWHLVHILAYGDTSAWLLRSGTRWEPQHAVKNEGAIVASSATDALPYLPEQPPPVVQAWLGADDVLVLISDGIGDPLGDGTGTVGAFLAEQWRRPPEPLAFAAHIDFARRSHDDDRTALAIWPHNLR